MSHFVARGKPFPAQLYLDRVLDAVLETRGLLPTPTNRARVTLAQLLYHCLYTHPHNVFMINAHTSEVITNGQILKDALWLARALVDKDLRGKTVTLLMRNHQRMTAMYLANLFAQTFPFMQDPCTNALELSHFLKVIEPHMVFCDKEHENALRTALEGLPELNTEVVVMETEEQLQTFANGFSRDVEEFEIPDRDIRSSVMMLPTSGATGLPKAAIMTEGGTIAQIPGFWLYHTQFPRPTALMLIQTTLQWISFTLTLAGGVVYHIPLLMSPKPVCVNAYKDMLIKFRPTWTLSWSSFMQSLLPEITSDYLSSMKTIILGGSPSSLELKAAIQGMLSEDAQLCDGYGSTEAHGVIAFADKDTPTKSNGRVTNIFQYKLLDSSGTEIALCQQGELYVKGVSCFQGYYKNNESFEKFTDDGWYKTEDLFYIDEQERLYFLKRIKNQFKFLGYPVSPEEVEAVIGSVEGVAECVVCSTEAGPAAAVVVRSGHHLTAAHIHKAVDGNLSHHKRLHGGLFFVPSLLRTPNGKLKREECQKLVMGLTKLSLNDTFHRSIKINKE